MPLPLSLAIDARPLTKFLQGVPRALDGTKSGPMAKAHRLSYLTYADWAADIFTAKSHGGGGWAPLKPATIARRKARGRAKGWRPHREFAAAVQAGQFPILYDTGRLYASLTEGGGPDAIRRIRADGWDYGTAVPYAARHQYGDMAHNLPARPPLPTPDNGILGEMTARLATGIGDSFAELAGKINGPLTP